MAPAQKKRKTSDMSVEEISFDFDARTDYLTGFHKRKVQRIKRAQEESAKKEKALRIEARRKLREDRKLDLEKHVESVNVLLREAIRSHSETDGEEEDAEEVEEWGGFAETPAQVSIDHEAEYIDEGRFTTVSVEDINITRNGIEKAIDGEIDSHLHDHADGSAQRVVHRDGEGTGKRVWTKAKPDQPKKKKKKFRYESKADRKVTRHKERAGGKAKAKARRE